MKDSYSAVKQNNAGMALLTALIFISVAVLVLTSMTARYVQQRIQTDRFEDQYLCFEAAEAAIQQGTAAINNGQTDLRIGIPETWEAEFDQNGHLTLPNFEDDDITPASFVSNPNVEYIMYIHNWETDGRDTNGDGLVDSDDEAGMFSIHAAARLSGTAKSIEAVYDTRDFGIWNNAIFAGVGQSGALINGNVNIAGSVHLLGDDLPEGALALDMSGTGMMRNNYTQGKGPSHNNFLGNVLPRIPALATTEYNGNTVETLNAELRVKNGIVAMSGNSHIGESQGAGDNFKGPVDSTWVTDGWGGNSGTSNVFSDNGTDEAYDLGNSIGFPILEDNYRDKDTGEFVYNPSTGTWYTHAEYFVEVLTGGENRTPSGGTFNGDISLDAKGNKVGFYWNATTGEYKTGNAANGANPDSDEHYILKKTNSDVIQINGCIHVDGDLSFTGKGTFAYHGAASILVEGDVSIETDLLACDSSNNSNNYSHQSFPYNSCMGIMSRGPMELGLKSSQRSMMGAFYSASRVSCGKQLAIGGTIVGDYFEMGAQVPGIWQVPVLADNLPLGMIGDYPIFRTQLASWREIGVN